MCYWEREEPYKLKIDDLLSKGVWNAQVILREIQADGYSGGYTILRQYIQPKRVLRPIPATVRFETQPGKQLQSDWGEVIVEIAGQPTKVHFIVNELGYSRRFHFWCTDSEDAEHTYEGIIRSFEYLGGVTEEVLVDTQKCAVGWNTPARENHASTRVFWTWLGITVSPHGRASHTGPGLRGKMNAW